MKNWGKKTALRAAGLCFAAAALCSCSSLAGAVNKITTRALTSSDYTYSSSEGFESFTVRVTAETDISVCTVAVKYLNSGGSAIGNDQQSKTDIIDGDVLSYDFSMTWDEFWGTAKISYLITGTVKL